MNNDAAAAGFNRLKNWHLLYSKVVFCFVFLQEEEEGSDEENFKQQSSREQPLWLKTARCMSSEEPQFTSSVEMSGTPVVSPLDEGKTFHAQIITMATLHEASRYSFSAYRRVRAHVYNKPEAFIRFALG